MNKSMPPSGFLSRLLQRTGGFYVVTVLAVAQVVTTPLGILLAALILYFNAEFTINQIGTLALFTGTLMLIRNILLLLGAHLANRILVTRLNQWKAGESLSTGTSEEIRAWRQITHLAWRYIAITYSALMILVLIPVLFFAQASLNATQDQMIYITIAGIVAGVSLALVEVLMIERMLIPARLAIVPTQFEAQRIGVLGFRLLGKFTLVMVAIVLVSALLVAPIGYHQTVTVLYREIGSIRVLQDLQIQSVVVGGFAVLLGLGLSFFLATSISQPVGQLIQVFQKFEQGDLKERVNVSATDEVGELAVHFNHMADRLEELQTNLEKQVANRTEQLRATIEVGQVASSILDPGELISRVVNMITERFGYYYAAIFLSDSTNRWAELQDATGDAGATMKARGHKLEIGGMSMVGTAITRREARIALDVGQESVRFDNPLLPETRSEIALPLIVGDRVLGALDVQSTQEAAFDQEDIDTLQGMANQVSIALENARLFQETRRSLDELRSAQRLYVSDAWSGAARMHKGYEFQTSEAQDAPGGEVSSVEVPLTLREQEIGSLSFEGQQEWTSEERDMIEAVATQAAIAMENARLLEQSQQAALRERLVSEITGKLWASTNMDQLLQTAVKELGQALRADEASIELM